MDLSRRQWLAASAVAGVPALLANSAFAADEATRQATGDPRPAIAQRYHDRDDYVARVRDAALALVRDRLLLAADADQYVERARQDPRLAARPSIPRSRMP